MAQVAFHFNVADPIDYVCRLTRKVRARNLSLVVCADPADVAEIDQRLWTLAPLAFLPHAGPDAPPHVAMRSPVRLCTELSARDTGQVLVNLRAEVPNHLNRFERVVEIVPMDEPARVSARQRWRGYAAQGMAPERHDVAATPPSDRQLLTPSWPPIFRPSLAAMPQDPLSRAGLCPH
jgi:DNA polymerase-3 subunit chi